MERIYTIPINEAFDASRDEKSLGCPLCALYRKLEENELELSLGAPMMEPDIRIQMNNKGFCKSHYNQMMGRGNRLSLALILESHMAELRDDISGKGIYALLGSPGSEPLKRLEKYENTCYICSKVNYHFDRIIQNTVALWNEEEAFKQKYKEQPYFCLSHYRRLLEYARHKLPKKAYAEFYRISSDIVLTYFDELNNDVSWFCKKFDYRYENEPWHNAKDAIERAVKFLRGELNENSREK
ncbi:MAG: hypothetical protein GX303_08870 [Clostridiales bacterium]|nr:hypothetical protein [Clostridiales bacterium]